MSEFVIVGSSGIRLAVDQPTPISTSGQIPTQRGVLASAPIAAMADLPGQIIIGSGNGFSYFPTDRTIVQRGTLELAAQMGAAGSARLIGALADVVGAAARGVRIESTATNAIRAVILDNTGALKAVGLTTATYPAGQSVRVRLAWDSVTPISGLNYATLRVNYEDIPITVVPPTAAWNAAVTTLMSNGVGLGGVADFNGTVLFSHAGTVPFP